MKKILNANNAVILSLILIASVYRMTTFSYPGLANFNPLMALALFSGAYFSRNIIAVAAPLIAMLVSDIVIGFHNAMPAVYLSFAAAILLGYLFLDKKVTVTRVIASSLSASTLFFIVTNFWVWAAWGYYSHDLYGLGKCYALALPFYRTSIAGDLIYSGAFFGAFALAGIIIPSVAVLQRKQLIKES